MKRTQKASNLTKQQSQQQNGLALPSNCSAAAPETKTMVKQAETVKQVKTGVKQLCLEDLEILQIMGQGAFGKVFKARIKSTNEVVALKQILENKKMMNRETQILDQLKLDSTIPVIYLKYSFYSKKKAVLPTEAKCEKQISKQKKYLNLVTDFMPFTLSRYNELSRQQYGTPVHPDRILQIKRLMYQFFKGLSLVHSKGISHRDIKPDNILISQVKPDQNNKSSLDNNDKLKICDFGSAKHLPKHNTEVPLAGDENPPRGSVTYISTRYYRGPELLFGNLYYGFEIDIWAAGCVFAELFTKGVERTVKKQSSINQESYTMFRGDSNTHQLFLVIQQLGVPTEEQLVKINPLMEKFPDFNNIIARPIRERLVENTPNDIIDLIEQLLQFAPQDRPTAEQALKHPCFAQIVKDEKKNDLKSKPQSQAQSLPTTSKTSSKATSATTPMRKNDMSQAQSSSQNIIEVEINKKERKAPEMITELEPPRKRRRANTKQTQE